MILVPGLPAMPLQYAKAIRDSDLPTGARAVCWALAAFAANKTGEAWPSLKKLAKATDLTRAVISKHTILAEEKGFLCKKRRFNGSILYTITIPITDDMVIDMDADASPYLENSVPPGDLDTNSNR
ncbi:Helix-turn-helix domain-containing protein [Pseudarthrobacter equi]|uniref:Helix-turn-helix domain-containing protein n=1 Tax=Pseudarthrobacter equi TaxID=728066 RepID=A0A1H1VSU4_9MICC|nr:helix-turn-helix domain-containing protein [Pseudarthrobacter equi]SDS88004.1 Helix-turn-helix domain-containing protein [Pseudarthrobacter equi]